MVSSPGIPIPSAMPKVSPERPSNGADDGGDEVVGVDKVVVEPKVGADVMILKGGDAVEYAGVVSSPLLSISSGSKKRNTFENVRLNP